MPIKSNDCTGSHQFHPRRDQLCTSTILLVEEEFQLQEDLNSAHAKLGAAINLHYVCSACQGSPTVLSSSQIAYLFKKKSSIFNGKDGKGIAYGMPFELEQFGLFHVSLLAY
jgi:hypothetical protein